MGQQTKIEWTDATWNPVTGCTKVSAGCKNCYAERDFHRPYPGRDFTDVRTHKDRLIQPLKWRRPRKIFVNSMSDLFHESVPAEFLDVCFAVMALASKHTFQILTKRPERMRNYFDLSYVTGLPLASISSEARIAKRAAGIAEMRHEDTTGAYWDLFLEQPYRNVWLGVSVEDQKTADERIPLLLQTKAAVRFVSYEPALGPVNFKFEHRMRSDIGWASMGLSNPDPLMPTLDWVITGGESGPHARPSHPDWFRSVRDQCHAAGVPFFFKQWGEWKPSDGDSNPGELVCVDINGKLSNIFDSPEKTQVEWFGKKYTGRLLDGSEWNEFPNIQK